MSLALKIEVGEGAAAQPDDDRPRKNAAVRMPSTAEGTRTVAVEAIALEDVDEAGERSSDDFSMEALGLKVQDGGVIVYDPGDVSIWMLTAVHDFWEKSDATGRWKLSALKGAAQKKGSPRNSWFLAFENPDTRKLEFYRVSTGGRGKKTPTVTPTPSGEVESILGG